MGAALACCACNAATCVGGRICSSVTGTCGRAAKKSAFMGRLLYAVVLLLVACLAWLMKNLPYWIDSTEYLKIIPGFHGCTPQNGTLVSSIIERNFGKHLSVSVPEQLCYGTFSVYRFSFALALFHLIFAFAMIGVKFTSDIRHQIQHSWWSLKILAIIGLTVGAFFIPNSVYIPYGWIALIGSGLFILIQLILLVDFAHTWNETWVAKFEESQSKVWVGLLLSSTIVMYLASLAGTIVMFVFFTENAKECWFNPMFITLNLLLCAVFSIFSIHPGLQARNPRIGLLQSAVVTIYCTYLIWSALSSEPATMECTSFSLVKGPGDGFSVVTGLIFTFVAVVYAAFRASGSHDRLSLEADPARKALLAAMPPDEEKGVKNGESESSEDGEKKVQKAKKRRDEDSDNESEEADDGAVTYNYSFFHFTFFLAALYIAMVLTNWESVTVLSGGKGESDTILVDQGMASVWVKVISSWLTVLLYIWTMIAPILLPNREF